MTALTEQRIIGIRSGDRVLVPAAGVGSRHRRGAGPRLRRGRPGRHRRVVDVGGRRRPSSTRSTTRSRSRSMRLDGADTPLLHAVDAGSIDAMSHRACGSRPGGGAPASATSPTSRLRPRRGAGGRRRRRRRRPTEPVDDDGLQRVDHLHAPRSPPNVDAGRAGQRRGPLPRPAVPGVRAHLHRRQGLLPGRRGRARPSEHEVDLPQTGTITNFTIITPVQYPGQTETEPFARVHVLLDGTDVVLGYQPLHRRARTTDVRVGMRVAAVWASEAEKDDLGVHAAEGSLLGWMPTGEPDVRRPRPREQDLLMAATAPTTSRSSAGRISPMVRHTDKTETQMLLEVITGAVDRRRHHPRRRRLHLRRQLRLHRRPGVLVRAEPRRHRRVAAQARLARRDGRRVGAVRGVGAAAARRHRHRGGDGLGPLVDRRPGAHLPDGDGPVLPRAARRRRRDVRRAAGPGADRQRARSPSGRWPRSRPACRRDAQGQPARAGHRRLRRRRAARRATTCARRCAATTCRRSPTARARWCSPRGDRARELCERPGVDHRLRPPHRVPQPGHAATSPTRRRPASRPRPPGSTTAPVEVAELQAAFTHEEPLLVEALGLGADVAVNPSGGAAGGQPDHGHRPGPHRRGGARRSRDGGKHAHARALDVGSVPAAEPGLHPGGDD